MILFKIMICFMMVMIITVGIASTEDQSDSVNVVSNIDGEILKALIRAKREPSCINCKIPHSAEIQAIQNKNSVYSKKFKRNVIRVNRVKREPKPAMCGPMYPGSPPGKGPCAPPPPRTVQPQ